MAVKGDDCHEKILLLGDSIRQGYDRYVKNRLANEDFENQSIETQRQCWDFKEEYIMLENLKIDRPVLLGKYHKVDEPYDNFNRFNYTGWECDPATGLGKDEMKAAVEKIMAETTDLPHPVAKAKAFAYVLDHARIDVNEHDYFIYFYNWGRPLDEPMVWKWENAVYARMPEVRQKMNEVIRTGSINLWPDFDHVIPNWDELLRLGYPGLLERVRSYHESHRSDGSLTEEMDAFFTGMELTYEAILRLLDRLYQYALTKTHEKAPLQARCLKQLRDGVPTNTYEALQAMYVFFIVCECVDHYQTRSLGNGIDSTLLPFYRNDIAGGKFSREQVLEFLAYFFMQFTALDNYWGQPMYMGGTNPDGTSKVNDLSYDILYLYRELEIFNPKVQIKLAENTPVEFVNEVLDLLRSGISSFVFCCEPGFRRAMENYAAPEERQDFEVSGCYETRVRGDESSTGTGYVNVLKAVSLAIHNGKDPITGIQIGPETGTDFDSFEAFDQAVKAQIKNLIELTVWMADSYEPYLQEINPSNVYSATIERSLQRGVDGYAQGVKYSNSAMLCCGIASATDAALAVKALVFEEKAVTFAQLRQIMADNWEGNELLRLKALNLPHKYGNNDPVADEYAVELADFFSGLATNRPNSRGGVYKITSHPALQYVIQGQKVEATPDGRRQGDEYSKNSTAVNGMDRNGVTALIQSAVKLKPWNFAESFCLDVMMHPSAVQGEAGLEAMRVLLMTYLKADGQSIQFNIFDSAKLREAQVHPEKYESLQVRVCGWNALWNKIPRKQQDAFIDRAEGVR